jgi:hypothetical protein
VDGRICPDCENADHKHVELRLTIRETDRTGVKWDKWECPNCLYWEWEEVEERK